METNDIDYKKLLIKCMAQWIEDEGGCWDPDFQDNLSELEKKEVNKIRENLMRYLPE